ncbi:MAG: RNA ligase family protein [bacterium]
MIESIQRYPRTHHLEGSRLQPGDHDLTQVPLSELRGATCVVEEKLDGANAGISVGEDGRIRLQSRGHVLVGGAREKHWDLFKQWAHTHEAALIARIPAGATLYGEWLYAKHTIYYDQLPHYFLEFDLREATGAFWSADADARGRRCTDPGDQLRIIEHCELWADRTAGTSGAIARL